MQVSYDKAEMHMLLVIPTIMTDNDSPNMLLQKLAGSDAHFTGKMNISYVQTKSHPKQKFLTNGTLMINGKAKAFSFTSVLEHFPRGSVSCNLTKIKNIKRKFGLRLWFLSLCWLAVVLPIMLFLLTTTGQQILASIKHLPGCRINQIQQTLPTTMRLSGIMFGTILGSA